MALSVFVLLVLIALGLTVLVSIGKCGADKPLFVLCLIELLRVLPIGK